jgi:predicted pyridoxine 5'-phosphate oxidase superfamily flavin-nucleotide-binding protein
VSGRRVGEHSDKLQKGTDVAQDFGSFVFTPTIKALQERHGSRGQYARMEQFSPAHDGLGPMEKEFLAERDSFYMASVGSTGWPYIQHRGGPSGFVKVIDDNTIAFANFSGNKQYITSGNAVTDNRVALIFVDYPRQARLKVLGKLEIHEGEKASEWLEKVQHPEYKAAVDSVYVIHVEAFDWNCPQHIVPRFTAAQIRELLVPAEKRMQELEDENQKLREQLAAVVAR